jgi:hypothetical protein
MLTFTAHTETLTSGQVLKMTARVALLTRNIKIEGAPYAQMDAESFGARVIVSKSVWNGEPRSGKLREIMVVMMTLVIMVVMMTLVIMVVMMTLVIMVVMMTMVINDNDAGSENDKKEENNGDRGNYESGR